MILLGRSSSVLDANVLFPAPVRDLLLRLAEVDLYRPKWTEEIHDEWIRNLLLKRPDIKPKALDSAKKAMNAAFPDANVSEYADLLEDFALPDIGDRHIVAAAIMGRADLIITFNLKHFPNDVLKKYYLEAQSPDKFIADLIFQNAEECVSAFNMQVEGLKNPPQTSEDVLQTLSKCGLPRTTELLRIHSDKLSHG